MRNIFNPEVFVEIINDPNVAPVAVITFGIIASLIIVIICVVRAGRAAVRACDRESQKWKKKYEWTKVCADCFFKGENWGTIKIMDSQSEELKEYHTWIGEDEVIPKEKEEEE